MTSVLTWLCNRALGFGKVFVFYFDCLHLQIPMDIFNYNHTMGHWQYSILFWMLLILDRLTGWYAPRVVLRMFIDTCLYISNLLYTVIYPNTQCICLYFNLSSPRGFRIEVYWGDSYSIIWMYLNTDNWFMYGLKLNFNCTDLFWFYSPFIVPKAGVVYAFFLSIWTFCTPTSMFGVLTNPCLFTNESKHNFPQ